MIELILSIVASVAVIAVAEWLWFRGQIRSEANRKLIHIAHGTAAATWPFFVSMHTIIFVELLFLLVVVFDRKLHIIHGAKDVSRLTWGEFWYPAGLISLALMNPNHWVFAAAALHLALADAVAALVGTSRLGKHKYRVLSSTKSIEGSGAFFIASVGISTWLIYLTPSGLDRGIGVSLIIFVATVTTMLENVGFYGTDNILVPVVVALIFGSII